MQPVSWLMSCGLLLACGAEPSSEPRASESTRLSSSASEVVAAQASIEPPPAYVTGDLRAAPIIGAVYVDGRLIEPAAAEEPPGITTIFEKLLETLRARRAKRIAIAPSDPFPGDVILQAEEQTSFRTIKRIVQTAMSAGYPNVSFMVQKSKSPGSASSPSP